MINCPYLQAFTIVLTLMEPYSEKSTSTRTPESVVLRIIRLVEAGVRPVDGALMSISSGVASSITWAMAGELDVLNATCFA